MASNCDKKMSKKLSPRRSKSVPTGYKKFKEDNREKNFEAEAKQAKEELKTVKRVHHQLLLEIHKRRKFNVADYEKEHEEKETKIKESQTTIKELQAKNEELEQQKTVLLIEKNQPNITIRGERTRKKKQPLMIIKEDAEYEELQSKCEQLEQKFVESGNERNKLKSTMDDQEKKLIDSEIQLKAKDDRHAELQCDMQLLQNKLDESQSKNEELEQELVASENGKNELILTIADLSQKNEKLNQTIKEDATNAEVQLKTKDDIIAELRNELDNVKNDKQMLQSELGESQSTNAELEQQISVCESENYILNQTMKYERKKFHELQTTVIADSQKEKETIQNKYDQLQMAFIKRGTKLARFETEMKSLTDSNTALQTELDTVKKSKDESQNYIERLEFEKTMLEECLNDGNRFVSIKNVTKHLELDINALINEAYAYGRRHVTGNLIANIDYNLLNGKILILQSLTFGSVDCWKADDQLLKIENAHFLLLLINKLTCDSQNELEASNLLKYVIRCDLKELELRHQTLILSEFEKLTSSKSLEHLTFYNTTVLNNNGVAMTAQQLRKLLPSTCNATF